MLLLATVLFGLSVRVGTLNAIATLIATFALIGSIRIRKKHRYLTSTDPRAIESRLLFSVAVFGLLGLIGFAPSEIGPTSSELEHLPGAVFVVLALAAFLTRHRTAALRYGTLAVASIMTVAVFGIAHIAATNGLGFDVYHLHVAAAEAIAQGENPYTDVVIVPDGSPNAEPGDVITGYVYPPLTALSYALGDWLSPDARYTSLAAWLGVLSILGYTAIRKRSDRHLYVLMLLASVPGLWFLLRAAWTEPLSILFMAIALAFWARPAISGLGIGSVLASKQYFFVTGPVLLLHRDHGWLRRLILSVAVVATTIGLALAWDARAFWDSAVAFHTSTAPRPDSSNLIGLFSLLGIEWAPPALVPMALGLLMAIWAGMGSRTPRSFTMATGAALASSFLVSSQAFANYWFMVFGLCALALLHPPDSPSDPN